MSSTTIRRIDDATPVHAATDWKMAALSIAAAVGLVWWFELPLDFDVNAPSFNPAVFVPVVLVVYGIVQALKFLRGRSVGSRFGVSTFEMHGHTVATGATLRGRVITSRNLSGPGGFLLRLRCVEEERYADHAGSHARNHRDRIQWEAEHTVQSLESSSHGVPVEFAILADAADGRTAGNRLRWLLEVEATVDGARYEALFGVPVTIADD